MSTIKDVCKLAKVSKSTVSRVLNNHPSVSDATKNKVLKVISDLGYKPNSSAQALASNRSNSIGMLVGTLDGPFYPSLVGSAESTIRQNSLFLIATSGQYSQEYETDAINFLHSKQVAGQILYSDYLTDEQLLDIVKETPATVLLNRYIPEVAQNCICLDDELGGYLATCHLIENGHTKIACITGPLSQNESRDRLQGYRKALIEHGIDYDADLVVEGRFDMQNNHAAPQRLLDRKNDISAVFCQNDNIALGVYQVFREKGLTIGEDISVVGFDNSLYCPHLMPALTSVNFPTKQMGVMAAEKVIALIKGTRDTTTDTLAPELMARNSVKKLN